MQITYNITKKLQLKLASKNSDAARCRADYLDNKDISAIMLTHGRVHIDSEGKVTMDLTWQRASVTERRLYADKAGAASGVVSYKQYYVRDRSVSAEGSTPEFDFLIESKMDLAKALIQIAAAEESATSEVDRKNAKELEKLPAMIQEYNEREEERETTRKEERLAYLERQNSLLREENDELQAQLTILTEDDED